MEYSKIILSGKRNVGKTTLFWQLQKQLGWPYFAVSHFITDYIRTNGLQGAVDATLLKHDETMRAEIDVRVIQLLESDKQVLVEARVFEQIKQDWPNTLKVLLTANDDVRVARNAFRENISVEKSANRLIKRENKWLDKIGRQFGFTDFFDPSHYDLVIDTSEMVKEEVVAKVLGALR